MNPFQRLDNNDYNNIPKVAVGVEFNTPPNKI